MHNQIAVSRISLAAKDCSAAFGPQSTFAGNCLCSQQPVLDSIAIAKPTTPRKALYRAGSALEMPR